MSNNHKLPTMWILRDISDCLKKNNDVIQLLMGPRQVGKTSLLEHISEGYRFITLDDLSARRMAQDDPEMFIHQFGDSKVIIDEAQYAPNLFPSLKKKSDQLKREKKKKETHYRLTGSNQILMDKAVKEGLTGRASYFELNSLSVSEILNSKEIPMIDILYKGGWPELYLYSETNISKYLNDYITSYIEKDIVLTAGIQKTSHFLKYIGLLAGRSGQIMNYSTLAKLVGVDTATINDWTSILERMKIISLAPPFFSNLSKRLVKSPKIYFLDTGLACRLQGWGAPAPIITSPQIGPLFETLVYSEIYKFIINNQKNWKIFHWRTRDNEEIDFIIQLENQSYLAIEAKVSPQTFLPIEKLPHFSKVIPAKKVIAKYVCHFEGDKIWNDQIPVSMLSEKLKSIKI